jgi:hypothetical protein
MNRTRKLATSSTGPKGQSAEHASDRQACCGRPVHQRTSHSVGETVTLKVTHGASRSLQYRGGRKKLSEVTQRSPQGPHLDPPGVQHGSQTWKHFGRARGGGG